MPKSSGSRRVRSLPIVPFLASPIFDRPLRVLGMLLTLSALLGASLLVSGPAAADAGQESYPSPSALEFPPHSRGAVPTAKAALGTKGRVLEVRRGPGSTYAAAARRSCGPQVLRDSVYVVVHPVGVTCSACDLHAYVVKFEVGGWKIWTVY